MNKKQKICLFVGTIIFDIVGLAFLYVNLISRYRMATDERYKWFLTWEPSDKRLLLMLIAVTTVSLFYVLTDKGTKKKQEYKKPKDKKPKDEKPKDEKLKDKKLKDSQTEQAPTTTTGENGPES